MKTFYLKDDRLLEGKEDFKNIEDIARFIRQNIEPQHCDMGSFLVGKDLKEKGTCWNVYIPTIQACESIDKNIRNLENTMTTLIRFKRRLIKEIIKENVKVGSRWTPKQKEANYIATVLKIDDDLIHLDLENDKNNWLINFEMFLDLFEEEK